MKRAVGYVRVSTEEQARHGASLEDQRARIAAYCAANGLELVAVREDAGISGAAGPGERPGLRALLEDVRSRGVDAVVFPALDRLSRSVRDLLALVEDDFARVEVHSLRERIDTGSAAGRFVLGVLGCAAELERGLMRERTSAGTRAALARRRAAGVDLGGVPLGFRREGKRIVPDPGSVGWRTARRIVALRGEGWSYRRIAAALDGEGVPARRGGRWTPASVRSVERAHRERAGSAADRAR